jgi:transcriptional regulator with XRE-family HTH domain
MIRQKIGFTISQKRKVLGFSQRQLAEILGVHNGTISQLETGKWAMSIDYLQRLCEVLDLEVQLLDKKL